VNERTYVVRAVVAAVVLAVILGISYLASDGPDASIETDAGADVGTSTDDESWEEDWLIGDEDAVLEGAGRRRDEVDRGWGERPGGMRGMGGMDEWRRRLDGGAEDPEWAERRARRRERFLSRIEVVSLGPGEPTTTNEDVLDAFRDVRPVVRDCLRASGLDRGSFRAMRETGRSLTFDLDSDGGVLADSVLLDPAPPEPFAGCMISGLEALTTEPPGGEGARVSIDFPARRRRSSGDAGTR
jgi:hypothetical protein